MNTATFFHLGLKTLPRAPARGRPLGLDFHSHLLPGVDDGAVDMTESLSAITKLKDAGFTGAVMTPHIYRGLYDNAKDELLENYNEFLGQLPIDFREFSLYLGAEYFTDEYFFELIEKDEVLSITVGYERWVLIEFPYHYESQYSIMCLSALAARGYRPVIAHVERYAYVARGRTVWLSRFARAGAILQCNLGSLAGQHGQTAQRFAEWLLAEARVDVWASDLHKPAQMDRYVLPGLKRLGGTGLLNPALAAI